MKTNKKNWYKFLILLFVCPAIVFTSCEKFEDMEGNGKISLNVTDAPIDEEGVTGVYVTFTGVAYQKDGGAWETFEGFEGPVTINLLELQNGKTTLLGDFNAGAGNYTGIRFQLDAETEGSASSTAGCYITYEDGTKEPLFVPSGAQTGYKVIADFTVPVSGTVGVTTDFDLRKSVVKAGASGKFLLKPTIRAVVDSESGEIKGNISNTVDQKNYVVFAYAEGTYTEEEATAASSESPNFPNAITSTAVEANGDYVLAFLEPQAYDLIYVEMDAEGKASVVETASSISVESGESVVVDITVELNVSL